MGMHYEPGHAMGEGLAPVHQAPQGTVLSVQHLQNPQGQGQGRHHPRPGRRKL